jgi:hypothetical protein
MNGKYQFRSVGSRTGYASQEVQGTLVYLIAHDARGLARWEGAERESDFEKFSREEVFAGGTTR